MTKERYKKTMKTILINTIEELRKLDISDFNIAEDTSIDIKLKLVDELLEYPIKVIHSKPNLTSNIKVKIAIYGKGNLKMPVEIWVKEGAINTSTNFKALVYLLSNDARAEVTPGLFIHEKNIQSAGHGVIIKNIKDKDTFYLRSRGIEKEMAKELIVGM
jgi:Fe-S cluster assembly protein SufD